LWIVKPKPVIIPVYAKKIVFLTGLTCSKIRYSKNV
jgi:hypothetical protein